MQHFDNLDIAGIASVLCLLAVSLIGWGIEALVRYRRRRRAPVVHAVPQRDDRNWQSAFQHDVQAHSARVVPMRRRTHR